jgi:antitoxin HicB
MKLTYTVVVIREDDEGYSVSVPALKGCHTCGDTLPEALWMVNDAIRLYLESIRADGKQMPPDVARFTLDMGEGTEAAVYKVSIDIEETAPVA